MHLSRDEEDRAAALHRASLVVDTHNDAIENLMAREASGTRDFQLRRTLGERSDEGQVDIPRIREGGVNCLIFAMCATGPGYRGRRLKTYLQMIDVFHAEVAKNAETIALATTHQEVLDVVAGGRIAALLAIEGGEALEGDIGVLRMLYRLGVRVLTLTHFPRNELGDGSRDDAGSHLTAFGVEVVEEMTRLGMIIDISHLNERGFWDVMERTTRPIIASHSNCKALCNHHRNLTDAQIEALAATGGVINLSYCGGFIKEGVTRETLDMVGLDDWLDHVDHVIDLVGPDYVGLGSDFDGGCGFPGMDDISQVPRVTRGLVARGYADAEITKILGGNNLRVFKDVLS
jgi:membrane dipeptidase